MSRQVFAALLKRHLVVGPAIRSKRNKEDVDIYFSVNKVTNLTFKKKLFINIL